MAMTAAAARRTGFFTRGVCVALFAFAPLSQSAAQSIDCNRLRAELANLPNGPSARGQQFSDAANRQLGEINRTAAYAGSLGCDRRQFLIFGAAPPPECGALNAQIARMRANLAQLQGAAQNESGAARRRDLAARYEAYCRAPQVAGAPSRGLFGGLFDANPPLRQIPLDDLAEAALRRDATPRPPRGGSHAVCVRSCDGAFFPVSYSAARGNLGQLDDLCHALCPNAEAAVYTFNGEIDSAVSSGGEAYKDLPNAFKYRTSFDPACTCKAPGQSWVQALAEAERMLGERRSDIVVTEEKSEELLRARPERAKAKSRTGTLSDDIEAGDPPAADAPDQTTATAPRNLQQGELRNVAGPDGVRRKIRTIAPQF